jgi:hypothetical protein
VSGPDDVEHAHRARIEGKRLRYLLEPLRGVPGLGAREAVRRLKALQDVLGELHDAHVLEAELVAARREASGGPRPPALSAVARLGRSRRNHLHAELVKGAAGGDLVALAAQVKRVADGLEARRRAPVAPGVEPPARAPATDRGAEVRPAAPPAATTH